MEAIRRGTSVLLNGARGLVLGEGTRSSPERPNLMLSGDLHDMKPDYIGDSGQPQDPRYSTPSQSHCL